MNQTQMKQPFFVQFLESQKEHEAHNVITYPWKDQLQTQKYPSDSDEEGETA